MNIVNVLTGLKELLQGNTQVAPYLVVLDLYYNTDYLPSKHFQQKFNLDAGNLNKLFSKLEAENIVRKQQDAYETRRYVFQLTSAARTAISKVLIQEL